MKNPVIFFPSLKNNKTFYGFAILLSLLFSIIFSGNVLGFLNRFFFWDVVIVISLAFIIFLILYITTAPQEFVKSIQGNNNREEPQSNALEITFLIVGIILLIVFIFFPLSIWPKSSITEQLPYDAALYHFPKAINLFQTGSIWDQSSIAYWDYPFGYENLLSTIILFTGGDKLFNIPHLLIALFFFSSLILLGRRHTKLSWGVLIFISALFLLSEYSWFFIEYFDSFFDINRYRWIINSNPWRHFYSQFTTIGKNDLFIAAATLSMILHIPISGKKEDAAHPYGLAMSSMLVFSIKPNGALLAIPLWLITLFWMIRIKEIKLEILGKKSLFWALVMIPGLLWAVRNYLLMKNLFLDTSLALQQKSISSLFSRMIEEGIPLSAKFLLFFLSVIFLLLYITQKKKAFLQLLLVISFLLVFIFTPASANLSDDGSFVVIQWRFALAFLGYLILLFLVSFEFILLRILGFINSSKTYSRLLILIITCFSLVLIRGNSSVLNNYSNKELIIKNYFSEPVGEQGYHSAYEYIQENLEQAHIRIDHGLPYYAYGSGFTNFPTVVPYSLLSNHQDELQIDTYLIFVTENSPYPTELNTEEFNQYWHLVYEDSISRIYRIFD